MTPEQATPYRQQLIAMHTAMLAQMSDQRGGLLGRAEAAADHFNRREDSSAQVATERELEFAIGERETSELALIDAALARIDSSSYGECINCAAPIPAPRLQASPEAPRCIACQEKFEQRQAA
ncbi:TraR/DksA family transcriptional regulator [Polaromonas sp. CG_9.11]|uniref:TraR/DksA family transcriptional regulator n=1 Tax=Polaromonas sp. CG_9.11 TaxID=2787730 RepID=UPI0018CAA126|nr:TraR/DksA family transcriptional regulator [Polaromonas sp. CG_9.11]MBG6075240.1 DnaK suppressor protein [Polaromonas sp. CG_9.11]